MANDIVLSSALRQNLLSLTSTQSNIDKTQNILSTGLKVSSALDNPQNFFAAQALKNRSADLGRRLDGIGQSIQTIKTADKAVTGLTKLVEQADSILSDARGALANGGNEASITGNVDLSGVRDLSTLTNVSTLDTINFTVTQAGNTAVTAAITVGTNTGDSIDQFIAKINDVRSAEGTQLLKAELSQEGFLKITAINGAKDFTASYDQGGSGSSGVAADLSFASALGFGNVAKLVGTGATRAYETTAVASNKLVSGSFYKSATEFADASTALTSVTDSSTARFVLGTNSATGADLQLKLRVQINEDTAKDITLATDTAAAPATGLTIQGLVDSINTDSDLNTKIKASYDSSTGKFNIETLTNDVNTIRISSVNTTSNTTGSADTATGQLIDFDFGTDRDGYSSATDATATATTSALDGEAFVLGKATTRLGELESNYNTVLSNIDSLVKDSGYRGVNLLNGDKLTTFFNEDRSSKLETQGTLISSTGLGLGAANFSSLDKVETTSNTIATALGTLRNFTGSLANSLSIIQTREDFTKELINNLTEGSDKLTLSDQNEEGAKLLSLQTRQQLGVQALSLASQSQQSVLRLF